MVKYKKYKDTFFQKINAQNAPKPKPMDWYVRVADANSIPEHTVCGYEFTTDIREDTLGKTEGFSPSLNFRMAFLPEVGHYWLSRDFSGQELRLMANLAGEDTWINTFLTGGDPHKATAIAIWGEEGYDGSMRKKAKAINFGLLYGKGAYGLAEDLNISEDEAQGYIDKYFEKLPRIKEFLDRTIRNTEQTGSVKGYYGRKRRMVNYISHGRISNAGKRKSYNHPIQSMGAEVTKLALIKVYNNIITKPEYKDKVYFLNTIHDEINLSVQYDLVEQVAYEAGEAMLHTIPGKPVPINTGLEIGHSMGKTWKFSQDPETKVLTPVYEPLEEAQS